MKTKTKTTLIILGFALLIFVPIAIWLPFRSSSTDGIEVESVGMGDDIIRLGVINLGKNEDTIIAIKIVTQDGTVLASYRESLLIKVHFDPGESFDYELSFSTDEVGWVDIIIISELATTSWPIPLFA